MQDASSIPAQHRKNQEFAARMGWPVAEELSDFAQSGQVRDRAGFQELETRVRSRTVNNIIVESLDRLSRDAVDLPQFFKLTEYFGVEIHTLDRGRVTRLDVGLAGLINPIELEKIALRTHRTQEQRVLVHWGPRLWLLYPDRSGRPAPDGRARDRGQGSRHCTADLPRVC
jgi:DNA invertase Pin-like site-specific DNA recombinase